MEETTQKNSGYGKRPLWQWIVIYAIIGVVVYGLIYYFGFANKGGYNSGQAGNQYKYPATQAPKQQSSPAAAAPDTSAQAHDIIVTGTEFAFSPSAIIVKQGQTIQIIFKNSGKYPHNFTISDLNIQTKTIQPGEQDTVSFTPAKAGTYEYTCTVPGHAEKGMKGTLTVQ